MITRTKLYPVFLLSLLAVMLAVAPTVSAQEEPTPVPEPAAPNASEEPAEEPEEPAATSEPATAAEPQEPAEPEPKEATVPTVYRDKTLVTINGRAEMNGFIELVVQPHNEDPTKVRANIVAKTKTKKITKAMVDQLVFALGDRYKVKQTGDKTIMVKAKNKKSPPVAISLKNQNLAGVSVMIGKG